MLKLVCKSGDEFGRLIDLDSEGRSEEIEQIEGKFDEWKRTL